jgi:hypothetical protein
MKNSSYRAGKDVRATRFPGILIACLLHLSSQAWTITFAAETLTASPPLIIGQPQSQTVLTGMSGSFAVAAQGTPPFSYEWRFNGAGVPGETNAVLSLTNVQPARAGAYSLVIHNAVGIATSADATLTVIQGGNITLSKTAQASAGAPAYLGMSPNNSRLYAAIWEDVPTSRVQQFSAPDLTLLQTFNFGSYHTHGAVVVSSDGTRFFTQNYYYATLSQVDMAKGNLLTDSTTFGSWPNRVCISPDRSLVLVTAGCDGRSYDMNNDGVAMYDISNGQFVNLGFVVLNDEPSAFPTGFSADSQFAYVGTRKRKSSSPMLYEISLQHPIPIARGIAFPEVSLQLMSVACCGQQVYATDGANSRLWVIDRNTWSKTGHSLESSPDFIKVHPGGRHVFVLLPAARSVLALDAGSLAVMGRYDGLAEWPVSIEFNSTGSQMYVSHADSTGTIYRFDIIIAPPVPRLDLSMGTNNSYPVITASGPTGYTYQLMASSDLKTWEIVASLVNSNGLVQFTDPMATNQAQRSYKVLVQ